MANGPFCFWRGLDTIKGMAVEAPRFPTDSQRLAIVGRTGSGKTVDAVWHLSRMPFHRMPFVVYDFKRDSLLARIEAMGEEGLPTGEIGLNEIPRQPGIWFVHPLPDDTEGVQNQMWGIWGAERTGVFVDEGYMVCGPANQNSAFRALLTQGRSKHIPMIILSQRPVWMDRFVFSESDFFQVFDLNHSGDRKKIMEYVPADLRERLPEYHSYYHDVGRNRTHTFKPVPTDEEILKVFRKRLEAMKPKRLRRVI